jgi:hypothetical protein
MDLFFFVLLIYFFDYSHAFKLLNSKIRNGLLFELLLRLEPQGSLFPKVIVELAQAHEHNNGQIKRDHWTYADDKGKSNLELDERVWKQVCKENEVIADYQQNDFVDRFD